MTVIGLIGLAATGSPIAGRRPVDGNQLDGTTRTTALAADPTARGMSWSGTAREVAEAAPMVVSTVRSDAPAGRRPSAP
jgi:3-hydroxyisobutyrate dehydrogenase-like beta-hydroxyacid dehydrogenase